MITPEIKYFFSPDIDDLEHHEPPDPESFRFLLQMMVGPAGAPGEESFDVQVVTPAWLEARVARTGIVSGARMVVVRAYDWALIESFLRQAVRQCADDDWPSVALRLARFAHWEFEDYRPAKSAKG